MAHNEIEMLPYDKRARPLLASPLELTNDVTVLWVGGAIPEYPNEVWDTPPIHKMCYW